MWIQYSQQTFLTGAAAYAAFLSTHYYHSLLPFSDGWAKDDLIYQWKQKDPVQVVPNLHLPRFTLEQYKSAYCDVITNTGIY